MGLRRSRGPIVLRSLTQRDEAVETLRIVGCSGLHDVDPPVDDATMRLVVGLRSEVPAQGLHLERDDAEAPALLRLADGLDRGRSLAMVEGRDQRRDGDLGQHEPRQQQDQDARVLVGERSLG